jgi:hypothetical protein
VPCQYWYDNKWYDLTSFGDDFDFFKSTPNSDADTYAVYNFCRKINTDTTGSEALGCSSTTPLDAYATIINEPSSGVCVAASTDSYNSIETSEYT